ncbi:hypothetical protein MPLB_430022 [Mesorhizobium sp. ORS 3324]|nr:hypothetical protein MPLB_430022 [Mesorhizobium sp. ORS 3324]
MSYDISHLRRDARRVKIYLTMYLKLPPAGLISWDGALEPLARVPDRSERIPALSHGEDAVETLLPAALAPVPGVEQVGEAVIGKARQRQRDRVAEECRQPAFARRHPPDCDRNVGADQQPAPGVGRMQPAPNVLQRGAVSGQHRRLGIDVPELDAAGFDRFNQPPPLAPDAGIANRAARVVPDRQQGHGHAKTI